MLDRRLVITDVRSLERGALRLAVDQGLYAGILLGVEGLELFVFFLVGHRT